MKYRLIPLLFTCLMAHAFSVRDQGFFDLGFGPSYLEDVTINKVTTKYRPGPAVQTSVGLSYKNGLGIGLGYNFNFNYVKGEDVAQDTATELVNSAVVLNFMYRLMPTMDVSVFFSGGPGFIMNTDMKLRSTAKAQTSSTVTTKDGSGATTTVVTTEDNDEAADPYESYDNIAFGYMLSGGIEYRQNPHQSFIVQLNYLNTNVYSSSFNSATDRVASSFRDSLETYTGFINLRYYF